MTPNHYAYIKIAEGCDNGCSFCSIPFMRGLQKSRPIDGIVEEGIRFGENGMKEIRFDCLGVFTYSEEENILSASLEDGVPPEVKDGRKGIILDLQAEIAAEKTECLLGKHCMF